MDSQLKPRVQTHQISPSKQIFCYLWGILRAMAPPLWLIVVALLTLQLIYISMPFHIRFHCVTTRTCRPVEWLEETMLQVDRRISVIERNHYSVVINDRQEDSPRHCIEGLRQDNHELILQVARATVTQYSKDTLGFRDFAQNARVITALTSANHFSPSIRQLYALKVLSWFVAFDLLAHVGFPLNAALTSDLTPNSCWAFSGPRGQLGIDLSERIHVHNVTIDHIAQELAADIGQAPRIVAVWGRIDGEKNIRKARVYMDAALSTPLQKTDGAVYLPLLQFEYKLSSASHIQTFAIPEEIRSLQIAHNVVIVQIKDNWGSSQTCLYRIRVHGVSSVP